MGLIGWSREGWMRRLRGGGGVFLGDKLEVWVAMRIGGVENEFRGLCRGHGQYET